MHKPDVTLYRFAMNFAALTAPSSLYLDSGTMTKLLPIQSLQGKWREEKDTEYIEYRKSRTDM